MRMCARVQACIVCVYVRVIDKLEREKIRSKRKEKKSAAAVLATATATATATTTILGASKLLLQHHLDRARVDLVLDRLVVALDRRAEMNGRQRLEQRPAAIIRP